jgi:hypothetical protein
MNLATAIETMQLALKLEGKSKINTLLQRIIESLSNLASSPAETSFQADARTALDNLAANLSKIDAELSGADATRLEELGAGELFTSDLFDKIMDQFNANVATPSVNKNYVQEILNTRSTILAAFGTVVSVAEKQKWDLDVGIDLDTDIGFPVPSALCHNNLSGLQKQIDWINRFMLAWKTPTEIKQSRDPTSSKSS